MFVSNIDIYLVPSICSFYFTCVCWYRLISLIFYISNHIIIEDTRSKDEIDPTMTMGKSSNRSPTKRANAIASSSSNNIIHRSCSPAIAKRQTISPRGSVTVDLRRTNNAPLGLGIAGKSLSIR